MKQSLILIGGGVIATHYQSGLERSRTLELVAFVDTNPNCLARNSFNVPFYTDLNEALNKNPQIALLALPAAARDEIARKLLKRGIAVLTEKPMGASLEEITSLFDFAKSCNTPLSCIFHWKAADEVRFLKAHLHEFGKIKQIKAVVHDDYAADSMIRPDRKGLLGAWFDSGINVLSYFDEILDLTHTKLEEEHLLSDTESGQLTYAHKRFNVDGVVAEIIVDWTKPRRDKTSEIVCEKGVLSVNHTEQTVSLNGKCIFSSPVNDRLSSHYENLFSDYTLSNESERTLLLHKILFTGNAQ